MTARESNPELVEILLELAPEDGTYEVGEGVHVFRRSELTALNHGELSVSYCAIGQGRKHIEVGEEAYTYGPDNIIITSIGLPMVSRIVEASIERPYLSLAMDLQPAMVREVYLACMCDGVSRSEDASAFALTDISDDLLDATIRLVRATIDPVERQFLLPMIKKEIIYRLIVQQQSNRMRQIAGMDTISNRVTVALDVIQQQFRAAIRMSELAANAGMSPSSFHEHFKRVTGLTPLQYQKQLRLREARRLLQSEDIDAAGAGYAVGYSDPSHFNHDYKRMFGLSPMRDALASLAQEQLSAD